jgi:uncharacterized protein YqeY
MSQPNKDNQSDKDCYRFIIGELQRQPTKELSDQQVIAIFKKIIKTLNESPAAKTKEDINLIKIMSAYLPKEATEEEIISFINTIDFTKYQNKMQAMKEIMQHFGSTVDGSKVKELLK